MFNVLRNTHNAYYLNLSASVMHKPLIFRRRNLQRRDKTRKKRAMGKSDSLSWYIQTLIPRQNARKITDRH